MKYLAIALTVLFSTAAVYAQETAQQEGPCMKILEACKNAGFGRANPGGTRTSLSKDCLRPILDGQSVAGVTPNDSDITACKAKKSALKSGK